MSDPWDKQEGETAEAFEAFGTYLDQGAKRSQAKVGVKLGKSTALMNRWSAKWKWVSRAADWDTAAAASARKGELTGIEAMHARHIEMAVDLHTLGAKELAKWIKHLALEAEPVIKPRDLVALIDAGIKLERLSRGEADSIRTNILTGGDKAIELEQLSSLNTAELVKLAKHAIQSFEGEGNESDK